MPDVSSVPQTYQPHAIEKKWKDKWIEAGKPDDEKAKEGKNFVIVIPPPNITGTLHLGHTLTVAIEDAMCRYKRMKGYQTLWVPGTDHAGIATQTVVERKIMKEENKTRHDYGRESFLEKVWEWAESNRSRIGYQLKRLGISADWGRETFTMDEPRSKAVTEAFVRFFDDGLLKREERLVNWCCSLRTALSDIEVDNDAIPKTTFVHVPGYTKTVEVGSLVIFQYPVKGEGESISVATTRIETMLGDTAVAVHPEDERYKHLIGKRLSHPFFPDRDLRVLADGYVDPSFGTGAVKITPAHDPNDFEIGKRHGLEFINIFTLEGMINENGGKFVGQHRFACREEIQVELKARNLLVDKKPHAMTIPRCSRSNDIIEYMLMPQWWLDCRDMAKRAIDVVKEGELVIMPESDSWFRWMGNVDHWCISRQLWWGHQIPAYRILHESLNGEVWVAGRDLQEAQARAEAKIKKENLNVPGYTLERDPDVLDTWFSSGLFPLSVFGWPDNTPDLDTYYPTSMLETGSDILFFWVARMVMFGLYFTDKLPFTEVFLHSMIRDAHGKKMSKSSGNVVDPVDVIEGITADQMYEKLKHGNLPEKELKRASAAQKKDFPTGIPECGTDGLRMGLLAYTRQGASINLDVNRVVAYRHFCNKLWQACRLVLGRMPASWTRRECVPTEWEDYWILHRLNVTVKQADVHYSKYSFADAVSCLYDFWLYQFCDNYLEIVKTRLYSEDEEVKSDALAVALRCLDYGLRLLHPITPFVTEELYSIIFENSKTILALTPFPEADNKFDNDAIDGEFDVLLSTAQAVRSSATLLGVNIKGLQVVIVPTSPSALACMSTLKSRVSALVKAGTVSVETKADPGWLGTATKHCVVYLDGSKVDNKQALKTKLEKSKLGLVKIIQSIEKKREDPNYEAMVPDTVKTQNIQKFTEYTEQIASIDMLLGGL